VIRNSRDWLAELHAGLTSDHTTCTDCLPGQFGACDSHRCHAMTKKGARCKNRASKERGYTWCTNHGCAERLAFGYFCMEPGWKGWNHCEEHIKPFKESGYYPGPVPR
jgi:hypothetical protein